MKRKPGDFAQSRGSTLWMAFCTAGCRIPETACAGSGIRRKSCKGQSVDGDKYSGTFRLRRYHGNTVSVYQSSRTGQCCGIIRSGLSGCRKNARQGSSKSAARMNRNVWELKPEAYFTANISQKQCVNAQRTAQERKYYGKENYK